MTETFGLNEWIPTGPPKVLLPPDRDPKITMAELLDADGELYARLYYERSGRFLGGTFDTEEEADAADPYRFTRRFLPGGRLPWEK